MAWQHCYHGGTILFTIVSTMSMTECCSALMKQQCLFTVVETGENNIDRTSLFIVAQPCSQVVTVLMVEQCCNNIVIMAEQPCWQHCSLGAAQHCSQLAAQHCSRLLTTCNRLCVFTRVIRGRCPPIVGTLCHVFDFLVEKGFFFVCLTFSRFNIYR